jgi:hypothetical protein
LLNNLTGGHPTTCAQTSQMDKQNPGSIPTQSCTKFSQQNICWRDLEEAVRNRTNQTCKENLDRDSPFFH